VHRWISPVFLVQNKSSALQGLKKKGLEDRPFNGVAFKPLFHSHDFIFGNETSIKINDRIFKIYLHQFGPILVPSLDSLNMLKGQKVKKQ
jgi:hypothetical protein